MANKTPSGRCTRKIRIISMGYTCIARRTHAFRDADMKTTQTCESRRCIFANLGRVWQWARHGNQHELRHLGPGNLRRWELHADGAFGCWTCVPQRLHKYMSVWPEGELKRKIHPAWHCFYRHCLIWRNRNAIAAAESCRALSSDRWPTPRCSRPRPTFFCRPKKMQARHKAPQKWQSHTSAGKLKADAMARQQTASTRLFMEAQRAIRCVGGGRANTNLTFTKSDIHELNISYELIFQITSAGNDGGKWCERHM